MKTHNTPRVLRPLAIIGNAVFSLWILFNAIDSGFQGSYVQIASFVGILFLFALNIYLLYRYTK